MADTLDSLPPDQLLALEAEAILLLEQEAALNASGGGEDQNESILRKPSDLAEIAAAIPSGIAKSFYNFPERAASVGGMLADTGGDVLLEASRSGLPPMFSVPMEIGKRLGPAIRDRASSQSAAQSIADLYTTLFGAVPVGAAISGPIQAAADASDEYRGLSPKTSLAQKVEKAADISSSGVLVPGAISAGLRGVTRVAEKPLARRFDPARRAAMDYAEARGLGSESLSTQVKIANQAAGDLANSIPAELGAVLDGAAKNAVPGSRLSRGFEQLRKAGILDDIAERATSVDDIVDIAESADAAINSSRSAALAALPKKPARYVEFAPAFKKLSQDVEKLRKSSFTADEARAIAKTVDTFKKDITIHGKNPESLSDIYQNINRARRVKEQEFNSLKEAAAMRGDVPSMGGLEASIQALDELQGSISEALDVRAGYLPGEGPFSDYNATQSAVKSLKLQAEIQSRRINTEMAVLPSAIQGKTTGPVRLPASSGASARSSISDLISTALSKLRGAPSQEADAILRLGEMKGQAPQQIRRLMQLAKDPATLPMTRSGIAQSLPMRLGAGISAASASSDYPSTLPIPRTTEAVAQNPQAILRRAAEMSGGNPQLLQDLTTVLKEPNMMRKQMALMEFSKMLPGLFVESPFKSEWDGRIHDPVERDMFGEELKTLQRQGQIDSSFLAKQLSALNTDGVILPRPQPVQTPQNNQIGVGPDRYTY